MRTLKARNIAGGLERIAASLHSKESQKGGIGARLLIASAAIGFSIFSIASYSGSGNNFPEYHTNAPVRVGSETVLFQERKGRDYSVLIAKRSNGDVVAYTLGENYAEHRLELREMLVISPDGQETLFPANSPNKDIASVVESGKKSVDEALAAIVDAKVRQYSPAEGGEQK